MDYPAKKQRRTHRQEHREMDTQQPQPQLVQDDVLDKDQEIQALKAQIALMEQALKAPDTQLEVEPEQSADDVVEASGFKMPPALAMGLQMLKTPEGQRALLDMVSNSISDASLSYDRSGVNAAVTIGNKTIRASAWLEDAGSSPRAGRVNHDRDEDLAQVFDKVNKGKMTIGQLYKLAWDRA